MRKHMRGLKGAVRKTFASAVAVMLAVAFALPATAFAAAGDLSVELVGTTAVVVPGGGGAANYLLLKVNNPGDNYAAATYTIDATTPDNAPVQVDVTPVLESAGVVTYIKLPVPADVTAGSIVINDGVVKVLDTTFTATAAGIAAPEYIYGEVPMGFAEFNHFVTAGITQEKPTQTFFVQGATVTVPEKFIAAGGRTDWPVTGSQAAVDVISTATYGDSVHYVPSANLKLSYADPTTKADDHEVTSVKAVEVGISFDLLANATLLQAASATTAQSTAVLEKTGALTPKAESSIYKAQYLFADATWGAREDTVHNGNTGVATPWKPVTTTSMLYGNNWTIREAQINFNLGNTDGTAFWNDYLEYLYGGYIENVSSGEREPLVFLQNIFTHRGHTNIDVSINNELFPRFDYIGIPDDDFKIVLYAKGYEDIVVTGITLKNYVDGGVAIEQTQPYNVKPGDTSTQFEGNALHINGIDGTKLSAYAASATLSKGDTPVDPGLYSFTVLPDYGELELSVENAFFTGPYQGSYTINLTPETPDAVSKPLTFTVNKWLDRPTLSTATGAPSSADSEATALVATLADTVSFSNSEYAGAIATAGRTVSSIVDVTAGNTAVTASNVLKRNLSTDPYTLDLSTLTVGHTYRLTLITTNIVTGETPSTTATYYLTLDEGTTTPGDDDNKGTTGGTTLPATGDTSVSSLVMAFALVLTGSMLMVVSRIRQRKAALRAQK